MNNIIAHFLLIPIFGKDSITEKIYIYYYCQIESVSASITTEVGSP